MTKLTKEYAIALLIITAYVAIMAYVESKVQLAPTVLM